MRNAQLKTAAQGFLHNSSCNITHVVLPHGQVGVKENYFAIIEECKEKDEWIFC